MVNVNSKMIVLLFKISLCLCVQSFIMRTIRSNGFGLLQGSLLQGSQQSDVKLPPVKVCIVGGGFGGLYSALQIRKKLDKDDEVVLIDNKDSFVFLPLLQEFAMGSATQSEIAPTYSMLLRNRNIKFIRGTTTGVNFRKKTLTLEEKGSTFPAEVSFDHMVLAVGVQPRTDLIPGSKEHCLPFYKIEDAHLLKSKLQELLSSVNPDQHIRVAVIGGGYSGVEVAASVVQIVGKRRASVTIYDRNHRLMDFSTDYNRQSAEKALTQLGVNIRLNHTVREARADRLCLEDQCLDEGYQAMTELIILTSGTEQTGFVKGLDLEKDGTGRLLVAPTLQTRHPGVFALGDCSSVESNPSPATAQVAMQQAGVMARNIKILVRAQKEGMRKRAREEQGEQPTPTPSSPDLVTFEFLNLGEMLSLGVSHAAVTSLGGWVRLKGPLAAIGRRLVYCVRMPTKTQTARAIVRAGWTTTRKVVGGWFERR